MVSPPEDRLAGRNGEVWRCYTSGRSQEFVAAKFGISQQRVSQIVHEVKAALPDDMREDWRVKALETLQLLHAMHVELATSPPVPAFHAGEVLRDEDGNVVRDHSAQLAATDRVVKLQERASRILGLDAPVAIEARGELRVTIESVNLEALT